MVADLSFYYIGPRGHPQVARIGGTCLYPRSHMASPGKTLLSASAVPKAESLSPALLVLFVHRTKGLHRAALFSSARPIRCCPFPPGCGLLGRERRLTSGKPQSEGTVSRGEHIQALKKHRRLPVGCPSRQSAQAADGGFALEGNLIPELKSLSGCCADQRIRRQHCFLEWWWQ